MVNLHHVFACRDLKLEALAFHRFDLSGCERVERDVSEDKAGDPRRGNPPCGHCLDRARPDARELGELGDGAGEDLALA